MSLPQWKQGKLQIMGEVPNYVPQLIANELLIREVLEAQSPCFAMGYVEDRKEKCGFIAMRPEKTIPSHVTEKGMRFGHSVLGSNEHKVLHFGFEFYGHETYHGLVPAGNPIVQSVISTMLETQDYFFFAINPDETAIAFRSKLESNDMAGLRTNQGKFCDENCSPDYYEEAVKEFSANPSPPGQIMNCVCRNSLDYLDLTKYPLDLNPQA
jgi:hypothetical protein